MTYDLAMYLGVFRDTGINEKHARSLLLHLKLLSQNLYFLKILGFLSTLTWEHYEWWNYDLNSLTKKLKSSPEGLSVNYFDKWNKWSHL